ncbi:hypothetical protein [Carboxylicivirga sp. 1411-1]
MKEKCMSRKDFLKSSVVMATGLSLAPNMMAKQTNKPPIDAGYSSGAKQLFKNVRLETGFEYEGDEVVATQTALFCVEISDGQITKVTSNNPSAKATDAQGKLMLPAFKDMHIHLDKTFYGGSWRAVRKRQGVLKA